MFSNKLKFWKTIPTFALYDGIFLDNKTSSLLYNISPLVGVSNKLIHLNKVDFPDPDAPIILVTSPGFTEKFISFKTSWFPKDFNFYYTLFHAVPPY